MLTFPDFLRYSKELIIEITVWFCLNIKKIGFGLLEKRLGKREAQVGQNFGYSRFSNKHFWYKQRVSRKTLKIASSKLIISIFKNGVIKTKFSVINTFL